MSGALTEVYLLRHGATALNRLVPYRLQGRGSDPPLDETGRAQAEYAAETLSRLSFSAVYTSPLLRALQTAQIVGRPQDLEPLVVAGLIEAELGRWEGLTWAEAEARDPDHFARFMADPGRTPYPDGESFLDTQRRATPAIAELASKHLGERILIVGHNVLNRAYLAGVLGLPIERARALRQANCGFNVIHYGKEGPVVETLNAGLHLQGLAALS
jgi:broad specificity phosphatase PhoE